MVEEIEEAEERRKKKKRRKMRKRREKKGREEEDDEVGKEGCVRIGSAGGVSRDDPIGRFKVFVYELPSKYNKDVVEKDPRCLNHMFAAEIFMHRFLLTSPVRTLIPEKADWFYIPVYSTCDLTKNGLPLPFRSPQMMRSAIQLVASNWLYRNRAEGADHFFIVPHDFGACFHYQEEIAIEHGIMPLLQRARASLWKTFKNNPLFDISTEHPPTYYEDMQQAVFCLCPLGWAPWSPGLVEAVIFGCIPVIIADDIVLPFADAIPWEEIAVFAAKEDVPKLDTILTLLPTEIVLRKQRLLANPWMKQAMEFFAACSSWGCLPSNSEWSCS
ncbi:Exostosin family [Musa troglodytarum]|uniref:Exostosin family n=1 Tax=Musa troglodytarum TaxID=320322 RepID=A0A9E7KJK5_9LILI|nr:Exostosin family [Musa troglodytarum]